MRLRIFKSAVVPEMDASVRLSPASREGEEVEVEFLGRKAGCRGACCKVEGFLSLDLKAARALAESLLRVLPPESPG